MRLGLALAHQSGCVTPISAAVHQIFEMARAKGLGDEDVVAVLKVFQEWAGGQA